mgnify:FL=1
MARRDSVAEARLPAGTNHQTNQTLRAGLVSGRVLQWIAGAEFIGVGLWILIGAREG